MNATPKSWLPVAFSVLERIAARGSAAIVTLLLAVFAGPEMVGKYAAIIVAITIHQACTDSVIRQIGAEVWNFTNGKEFVRRASIFSAVSGVLIVITAVWLIAHADSSWLVACKLLPLVFVPIVVSLYLGILTRAQRTPAGWKQIAKSQSVASVVSLVIALPLLAIWDIGAAATQFLVAEAVFLLMMRIKSSPVPSSREWAPIWRRYYLPTSVSSVLGWSQSQLERLILVLLSTSGVVGTYSLAVAIARSAGDSITSGLVNAVRSQIAAESSSKGRELHLRRGIRLGLQISVPMQIVVTLACLFIFPLFLGPSWSEALKVAPVFASTGVFAAVMWITSSYIITIGQSERLVYAQVTGVVLSVACGYVLSISLILGAYVCIFRDVVGLCLRFYLVRSSLDKKFGISVFVVLTACVLLGLGAQFVYVQ